MEAAVSSSLGAIGPVLRKLDLLLAPGSRLRKRVKDGVRLLKEDLEEVSSALVDLSMLETPNPRAMCWMEEARELSYHVEDFVDELMLMRTDASSKIRTVSRHRVGRVKIALLPAPPRRSTRITKIAQLRALVWQATERLERYQLEACCSSQNHMNMITQHRRAPALYGDAVNLVGIEHSRTKLIEMLTGEAEQQLKVVSIVGPAGVGKTALAKEIFCELRGQFELWAFVHASRKIDMRRFLGSILSQVHPHHQLSSIAGPVQSLIDSIQERLQDKRYFIVVDDVWEETAWDIVRCAFPEGNNCSRIVATTESMNVALKCCGYLADDILKMKPLGIEDSRYLFFNRVFGSEQQCPDELKEVSYGIIRKCCGLPLSLIHVSGLLASIDYSELWYHVHDHLCSIFNRCHTVEDIQKKILNLSYSSLPPCLKTCLLYFNMYPEGYIMWKVHLVKQWIAEGFICVAEGKDREEIAEGYFEELVNRGMVQPMKIAYNDEVLSCTVHHIIFDLINHNSKEEEFIAAIDYSQSMTGLSTKAHRLSFRFSSAKYAKQTARITMSQLRSLAFFGFVKCMPPIVEFKHLRVLVLDFWGSHDGHMSLNLSRICILFQLRYLNISGDIMVELPAEMQGLHYLETLEIDARLSAVPLDIVHLPSLLHLGLRAATKLPDGIGHIKSLSTLLYFDLGCNSEDNIRSLGKLTNLQHLHLTCSAALSSEHLKRKLVPLVSSLGKFGNLKSLTLTPDALRTAIFFDNWSGISSPPMFLQKLELLPPICFFRRLPGRIGELHKLCILKIVVKELQGNDISNISGLPSLVVFSLYVRTALTGTIVFSSMAFPALKYFKFTCGVTCLDFQAGAMPNLQRLKLCFNAHRGKNHSRILDGIEHLLNLQEVAGRIGVLPCADESDWRVLKLLFEDTIRKHPRCPRFNSQLVDFIEEEYPPSDNDSRLSGEFDLPPASWASDHHKSDEYSKHHMLVSILRDESAEPTTLDLSLLEDITNNFSTEQEIDQGGFGMVYKGILGDGVVAVKRLYWQHETVHGELTHVVDCLMTVKHNNIVRFLGYWAHMQDMLLCFEYLQNGSLRTHITDESCEFEWHTRYQIMKGICQGLDYLHENHIIHLHLKPENILLDANMVPKIADYAYARLLGRDRQTAAQETVTSLDYLAPEYYEDGAISVKSDIYSLGVIIMQMVTSHKDCRNLESVLGGWRSRLESDTPQRHIALETVYRQVILCIELGKRCMHRDPTKRPCIRDIIDRLAEMEASEESSVTSGTSSVPKLEASLITPSPTSGKDILNHHQEIKKWTDKANQTEPVPTGGTLSGSCCPEAGSVSDRPAALPERLPRYGVTSVCGRRREMEDAVSIRPDFLPGTSKQHFFGVFDGHGCSHVATLCQDMMHEVVADEHRKAGCGGATAWKGVMERSFARLDEQAASWATSRSRDEPACRCEQQMPWRCDHVGSTAVVAVVSDTHVVVGNAGDSRAVLSRAGVPVPLSVDHKPDRPDELARIEAAGGRVVYWDGAHVLGVLAMSRAIGDGYLKPYVSSEPEVTVTERTDDDECLILASDGLWDVVTNEAACEVVRACFRRKGPLVPADRPIGVRALPAADADAKNGPAVVKGLSKEDSDKACSDAAMLLAKLALARRSADNVSVVVVDLRRVKLVCPAPRKKKNSSVAREEYCPMAMNQQPMGMGMGMNQQPMGGMNMGMGTNQGMPIRPAMGMGPGGMPGAGYDQMGAAYGGQQPYGGYR